MTAMVEHTNPKFIGKKGQKLYETGHRVVGAYITNDDYELLKRLAELHGVKISVYMRAIIKDALADEQLTCINIKDQ